MKKTFILLVWVTVAAAVSTTKTHQTCRNVVYNVHSLHQKNTCCMNASGSGISEFIKDIKAQVASLQSELKSQENVMMSKIRSLQGQVDALTKTVPRKAFHAEGSQREIHVNSIIKFGNVKMNLNGGYNPATSIFTCNDTALYLFYVTMTSYNGRGYGGVWYSIRQDGENRAFGFTSNQGGSVSSHFAMIRCFPGSHIWVKQNQANPPFKQGMWEVHSQFGGFIIAF